MNGKFFYPVNGHDPLPKRNLKGMCILALAVLLAVAFSSAQAGKPDVKKRKTDMDTGMALFSDDGIVGYGLISDNYENDGGYDHYCHGIDGQVSLVKRFIYDSGNNNRNERYLAIHPQCMDMDDVPFSNGCLGDSVEEFEVGFLGTYRQAHPDEDGSPYLDGEWELYLREMRAGEVWRATFSMNLGRKLDLHFGYRGFVDSAGWCGYPGEAGDETKARPVWVRCHAVDQPGDGGRCVDWTISTEDLNGTGFAPARGCIIQWKKGKADVLSRNVEANFTIDVKYLPSNAPCPADF